MEKLNSKRPKPVEIPVEIKAMEIPAIKENISFDDFSKLDLRTATIKHAEAVPKTEKLLKLTVNIGLEERTIVSGIAEYYKPEDIIGRQIIMVANLEPRKIKGIESRGMILMIHDENNGLVMITPENEVQPGSQIS